MIDSSSATAFQNGRVGFVVEGGRRVMDKVKVWEMTFSADRKQPGPGTEQ